MRLPSGYSQQTRIGRGAFSTVYRAWQKKLDRYVAVKVIALPRGVKDRAVVREAHTLASLQLSCVPVVYDVHATPKRVLLFMEYIAGIPLTLLREYHLTRETKLTIATEVVAAIAELHAAGVAHRDLKPDNVLITANQGVVLVDFGFSSTARAVERLPVLAGTPAYMAPELWSGDGQIDYCKVDLFALGHLLHELTGTEMEGVISTLLSKDPLKRPENGVAFKKIWEASPPIASLTPCRTRVAQSVAEYSAGVFFRGAQELFSKKCTDEAYALLTESLSLWPDNGEALAFLEKNYSRPIPSKSRKRPLLKGAVALAGAGALTLAYIVGRSASAIQSGAPSSLWAVHEQESRLRIVAADYLTTAGYDKERVTLRQSGEECDLEGSIVVDKPKGRGTLFVDGKAVPESVEDVYHGDFTKGQHRIE